jgi:hypothetical protein
MLFHEYHVTGPPVNLCLLRKNLFSLHESIMLILLNLIRNWYRYQFSEIFELISFFKPEFTGQEFPETLYKCDRYVVVLYVKKLSAQNKFLLKLDNNLKIGERFSTEI